MLKTPQNTNEKIQNTVALHNLGCKVNGYEMDVMQQNLQKSGYKIVPFDQKADIYIVNTCTVTNIADRKSRQMLHKAKKENPGAVVVAVGCYVQTGKDRIEKDDCIDLAIGNNKKKDLVPLLEEYLENREKNKENNISEPPDKTLAGKTMENLEVPCDYEELKLTRTRENTRAFIKIQDGCNQFCSYCVIPFSRGRVRSRKPEDVVEEVKTLADAGFLEVVITGIHLSSYGLDFMEEAPQYNQAVEHAGKLLLELLEQIDKIDKIKRIRLGSLEPRIISESFMEGLVKLKKVCPHFHLSLQSGCDTVLERMNRKYTTEEFEKKVELIRNTYEHPAITTDVIVGFPGETETEFEKTVEYLSNISLYELHIFKYSRRKGTVADTMKGQLTDAVKSQRSDVLSEIDEKCSKDFRAYYVGKNVDVLIEEYKEIDGETYQIGHTSEYVKVAVKSEKALTNTLCKVSIDKMLNNEVLQGSLA